MRLAVAALGLFACTKVEPTPAPTPVVVDAAVLADAAVTDAGQCVVRIELGPGRIVLDGGGISGGDLTALRRVATRCSARLLVADDVTFEEVSNAVKRIVEQGIAIQLGQPVGQWMAMDLAKVTSLWKTAPVSKMIAAIKEAGPRLGADNTAVVDQVVAALARGQQDQPIGAQSSDRGMFEAIAQIVGLRRATAPVAVDLLEQVAMPAIETEVATLGDVSNVPTGVELFQRFIARSSKRPAGTGLLGVIPDAEQSTPYADNKPLVLANGDWVVVAKPPLAARMKAFDRQTLIAHYEQALTRAKLRDPDRVLADTTANALADLAACVDTAVQHDDALVFRYLPSPAVVAASTDPDPVGVVVTKTSIAVTKAPGTPVLSALPATRRTIVIEADRSLAYGRIRSLVGAIGTPGHVTFVLRPR